MRTPTMNKGGLAVASGEKCPRCGRRGGACRDVPLGHFCAQYGLEEDRTKWIHPSPDPVSIVVDNDPNVIAARAEESLAVAEYEKRDEAWKDALCRLATARITGRTSITYTALGQQIVTAPKRRDRKREERLVEEEAEAREVRERAAKLAAKARHRQREATDSARIAAAVKEQGWR